MTTETIPEVTVTVDVDIDASVACVARGNACNSKATWICRYLCEQHGRVSSPYCNEHASEDRLYVNMARQGVGEIRCRYCMGVVDLTTVSFTRI